MKIRLITLVLISILLVQCKKDSDVGTPDPIVTPILPDPISARLQGNVLDENDLPANGVTVHLGMLTATTDAHGYFRFQDATLDKQSTMVSAEKAGYYKAYRTFSATSGTNQVIIKLIPRILTGTIDAATGGSVSLSNGGKVELPANGIITASNNSAYTGTVNVYATYIDPTAADINQTVPGSFMADAQNGARVTLESYGMMAVVLENAAGEKLQIKTGSTAILTTPIPASRLSTAPATIAMWSVNEQTGIWKEEGSATKQGNVYVGTVSHFSFWNCDIPKAAIVLSMTFHTSTGAPLNYGRIRITSAGNGITYGWTDSLGQVSGYVPSGETLTLDVLSYCGNSYYTQNIGPFSSNTDMGIISLPLNLTGLITISGTLRNCSNMPVTDGYATINYGYLTTYAATDVNGNFSANFSTCSSAPSTIQVMGTDMSVNQQSATVSTALTGTNMAVGYIFVCGSSADEFINYTLTYANGTTSHIILESPGDSLLSSNYLSGGQYFTEIKGNDPNIVNNTVKFQFSTTVLQPGTYPVNWVNYDGSTLYYTVTGNAEVYHLAAVAGEYHEGTFSAHILLSTSSVTDITGSFRIKRD